MSTPCVFISYRRDDSAGWAGRLGDDLADRVGAERIFRDVKIPAGVDYEQHIERVLDGCQVVIVVIGPRWATATATDATQTPRLHHPDDLLRKEIERALQRSDVEVIPVLVQRAQMPDPRTLPEGLRALTRLQAFELSDARWVRDMEELVEQVFEELDDHAPPQPAHEGIGAASAMVVAGAAGTLLATLFTEPLAAQRGDASHAQRLVIYATERGLIWAIVGALVLAAACVALRNDRVGALGWGIVGAGFGAVGGALGGAAFMVLKDFALKDLDSMGVLTHGVSTGLTGIVLGTAVAKVVSGEGTPYRLAGLVGGLLGAILALAIAGTPGPGTPESATFLLIEAVVMLSALAAVATALVPGAPAPAEQGQPRPVGALPRRAAKT
jgi:hypothetical protein